MYGYRQLLRYCHVTVVWVSDLISGQTCANRYTITRTYKATDVCGNYATCTQTITVLDTIDPVITGVGAGAVINCPATPVFSNPTASDNCASVTLTYQDTIVPGCGGSYVITRIWTASDGCNTANEYQTITVQDTTRPVISGIPAGTTTTTTTCTTNTTNGNGVCVTGYSNSGCSQNIVNPHYILGNPNS